MQPANKVIFNTIILYAKILICMLISLWTIPIVLRALGASDYGLYNLIAGVVSMLSFINGAMTVSTQRYLSVTLGTHDTNDFNKVYNVSIILHITIGIAIIILFEIAGIFLFNGFLNYPAERHHVALWLYQLLIVGIFFTIISVPYDSVLNAYENMLTFSIISILEALLRLGLAFSLFIVPFDLLWWYGCGISIIAIIIYAMKQIYVQLRYKDLQINFARFFNYELYRKMFGFAGWNTFGALAGVGRIQGIALILNVFFGTIINAAYGIANQVNGVLNYFSATIQKSINPQLMLSEGQKDRQRMIKISYYSSKYSSLLISMLAIPLIIEAPYILRIWLGEVPAYTVVFVRLVLIMSIINQFSAGIMSALQAVGDIKVYQLCVGTIILLNLPIAYFALKWGYQPYVVLISAIIIDIIALCVRLIIIHRQIPEFKAHKFIADLIAPIMLIIAVNSLILYTERYFMSESIGRLLIICASSAIFIIVPTWLFMMDTQERSTFMNILNRK